MFQHLWSMSVEEQFYLVWPFVVFALSQANIRRVLIGIIAVTLLAKATLAFTCNGKACPTLASA
jgi:peptidoglycan/LPS O-acetylase OafA/YrhL